MAIALGYIPGDMVVTLPSDADFVANLIYAQGWPIGTGIELHLVPTSGSTIVWTATITGTVAAFYEDEVVVQAAITAQVTAARLHYFDGSGADLLWWKGRISVA